MKRALTTLAITLAIFGGLALSFGDIGRTANYPVSEPRFDSGHGDYPAPRLGERLASTISAQELASHTRLS